MKGSTVPYLLLAVFSLCVALLLAFVGAAREFEQYSEQLERQISLTAAGRGDLAEVIRTRDRDALTMAVEEIAAHMPSGRVALYDAQGEVLTMARPSNAASPDLFDQDFPGIARLRRDASPTEVVTTAVGADASTDAPRFWPALSAAQRVLGVSAPVIHGRNPTRLEAQAGSPTASAGGSRVVAGYLVFAVPARTVALHSLAGTWALPVLFALLLPAGALCAWLSARRDRAAVEPLHELTTRLRQGDCSEGVDVSAMRGELRELFEAFNQTLTSFQRHKQELERYN